MLEEQPKIFLDKIVEKVKEERKKRNISQLKLASILDFNSPNYVAKIETRKHNVSYNLVHLCKIARAFDMEVIDFLPKRHKLIK
ncbi:transcriptional regulator [Arcobacter sp. CECT 8986]|uniref:helix-turn-helix domain-containing protein n=1 Tax=Arcobacter sp. CECT 8986 TaxID=2044507 RepID=UPI001009B266|nr:helix-turn-helix transcriptional regulator [Arcobacter sp. CECT 8986]RXK01180.1 transcriptional regulator [Arcobacter sp. CECT 8986]